jgi:hypothetical protein
MQSERKRDEMIANIKARRRAEQLALGHRFQVPFLLLASGAWFIFLVLLSHRFPL